MLGPFFTAALHREIPDGPDPRRRREPAPPAPPSVGRVQGEDDKGDECLHRKPPSRLQAGE